MSFVHHYSDGVNKPKLCLKSDMDILASRARVEETVIGMADKYKSVKEQRDAETNRKYPNTDFIKRCDVILARLLPAYQKVYGI